MESNLSYRQKLRDSRWLLKRQSLLETRGSRCQLCDTTKQLTIHHGYYRPKGNPWEYEDSSLWILCWDCHEKIQLQMVQIHQIIGHIHPSNFKELRERIDDVAFKVEYGTTQEELDEMIKWQEQMLQEERIAAMELYEDYSVVLTSSSDLGPTQAYYIENNAYRQFPGICICVNEEETGVDGLASVDGPDEKIRSSIQSWFDRYIV